MDWNKPVDVDMLEDGVVNYVLLNLGIEPADVTHEDMKKISEMSAYKLLDKWLNWHGLIGYTGTIIEVVENLQKAQCEKQDL